MLNRLPNGGIDRFERLADAHTAAHDTRTAERQLTHIAEEFDHLIETQAIAPTQQAHQRTGAWAKRAGWRIGRESRRDEVLTLWAADRMLAVFANEWCNRRHLPNLGAADRFDIGQVRCEASPAVWTGVWPQFDRLMNLLLRKERTLVSFVARLPACFAPTSGAWWRWGGGSVGGRRFGRRARGLAEFGLQLAHQSL